MHERPAVTDNDLYRCTLALLKLVHDNHGSSPRVNQNNSPDVHVSPVTSTEKWQTREQHKLAYL